MYTVYVLQDDKGNLYKGLTNNIERRLKEHKRGKTKTTKKMSNISIVYKEEFDDMASARSRELYFKSAVGRRFIKKQVSLERLPARMTEFIRSSGAPRESRLIKSVTAS